MEPLDFIIGIALLIASSVFGSAGLLLIKDASEKTTVRERRERWLYGFVCLAVVSTVLNVIVYGMLALTVIAPFAGLNIVVTLLLASTGILCTKQELLREEWLATAIIMAGLGASSAFGPDDSTEVSAEGRVRRHDAGAATLAAVAPDLDLQEELELRMSDPTFFIVAAVSLCTVAAWLALSLVPSLDRCRPAAGSLLATALSAYSAAVCGALGTVFLKIVSEALRANAQGASLAIWATVPMVVATVGLVACAPLSMYLLDTTLASGDVASAVPLYQTSLVLLTSAAGGVFFREFAAMGPPQAIGYTCGIALCLLGLGVLGHAHATEAVEQGERLSTLGEKSPEPPTPLAARLSMADRTAPSRWVATDRRMSVAQIAGSGVVGFGLFAANEMQSPPGLGRQRSMTLPARRVRESDGLLSGDLFGGRSRARTPPPGLVSQGSRRAQTPPPGSVSWKPGV